MLFRGLGVVAGLLALTACASMAGAENRSTSGVPENILAWKEPFVPGASYQDVFDALGGPERVGARWSSYYHQVIVADDIDYLFCREYLATIVRGGYTDARGVNQWVNLMRQAGRIYSVGPEIVSRISIRFRWKSHDKWFGPPVHVYILELEQSFPEDGNVRWQEELTSEMHVKMCK